MRLIDADALKKAIADAFYNLHEIAYIADIIERQPTIEPEVRHGKLIEGRYPDDYKCSACGQGFRDDIMWIYDIEDKGYQKFPPEYCPECGAKWSGCEFIDELEQKDGES
ncbi:MAG: hypothetical protein J6S92_13630 [Oscillospiraceae bacterium]|nr:hypothetical protein [Bacteroidaceae bacterium]MBP0975273.1 hypothetical protein [Oscillospiraceae bacterium]MBP0989299.1 hypothetical protein [Oscillospiraceae bacterium]